MIGEVGLKLIKDGFLYFDFFDEVMGYCDSVDFLKMVIEGSVMFVNGESGVLNVVVDVIEILMNSLMEEIFFIVIDIGEKRKIEEKSWSKVKRKRWDVKDGGIVFEW